MAIPIEHQDYFAHIGGENKQISLTELKESLCLSAENVDFFYPGSFEREPGYVEVNTSPIQIESGDAECIGMMDFHHSNGTQILYYAGRLNASPTYSQIGKIVAGTWTALTPAATPASDPMAVGKDFKKVRTSQMEDIALFVQEQTPPLYHDASAGMTEMRRLGLPPVLEDLSSIITANASGGSLADGTYRFRVVYKTKETTGSYHEGRANDDMIADEDFIVGTVSGGGGSGSIDLALPAVSSTITDRYGQIEGHLVYMTLESGATFYFKHETSTITANTVTITAIPTTVNNTYCPVTKDLPPICAIVLLFEGRWFFFNGYTPDPDNGDRGTSYYWDGMWWTDITGEQPGLYKDGKQSVRIGNFRRIDPGAGEPVLAAFVHEGKLYAAKRRKIYEIYEITDGVYAYREVNHATGVIAHDSVANTENLPIFSSERMVYAFDGRQVEPVGNPEEPAWSTELNVKRLEDSVGTYQRAPNRNRYWLLCTTTSPAVSGRHDLIMVYDYRLGAWRRRTDLEMAFLVSVEQATGEDLVYSADYLGFVYKWGTTVYNYGAGAQSDDVLRGTATAGGATTLSDTSKTWTVNEFKAVPVYIVSGTGKGQRRVIPSNTATQLTVSPAWTTNPDATSVYHIGAYKALYEHGWRHQGDHGAPKRYRRVKVLLDGQSKADKLIVRAKYDFEGGEGTPHEIDMEEAGAKFGTAVFGTDVFGTTSLIRRKIDLGKKADYIDLTFEHAGTNAPFRVYGYTLSFQRLSPRRSAQFAGGQAVIA